LIRRLAIALTLVPFLVTPTRAHLNSPNVYLEEAVGPWPAISTVQMPPAVPGEARVEIKLYDLHPGEPVHVRFREIPPAGDDAAPPWVDATPLSADASSFIAPMPLMRLGVWKARLEVSGARGTGTIDIPVAATMPPSRSMTPSLILILATLSSFLLVTATLITRALSRDVYTAGRPVKPRTTTIITWVTAAGFLGVLGMHGLAWRHFNDLLAMRTSRSMRAIVTPTAGPLVAGKPGELDLRAVLGKGRQVEYVAPDHGKMMHAVVVKVPEMTYFLHAHPRMVEPGQFLLTLQAPEAGRYEIFADVLSSYGVADTLTSFVDVGPGDATRATSFPDPDDSDTVTKPIGDAATSGTTYDIGSGLTMRRVSPAGTTIPASTLADLGFELDGPDGKPVDALQPYMGMAGHLLILRDDRVVFAHVHPMGTVANRMSMPGAHAAMSPEEHAKAMASMASRIEGARVSFPFGFPSPGRYRLFVQVKYQDAVRTGVFDVDVR